MNLKNSIIISGIGILLSFPIVLYMTDVRDGIRHPIADVSAAVTKLKSKGNIFFGATLSAQCTNAGEDPIFSTQSGTLEVGDYWQSNPQEFFYEDMSVPTATTTSQPTTFLSNKIPTGYKLVTITGYKAYAVCGGQKVDVTTTEYNSYQTTAMPMKTVSATTQ